MKRNKLFNNLQYVIDAIYKIQHDEVKPGTDSIQIFVGELKSNR